MNVKRSLENRIRGWLPKQPTPPRVPAKTDFRIIPKVTAPHLDWGTLRIAKFSGIFAAFWAILNSLMIVQNVTEFHISLISQLGWIVAGLTFGLILSAIFTLRQLKQLEKNHKIEVNTRDLKLLVIPLLLYFISGLLVSTFFYGFQSLMQGTASSVWLTSIFGVTTLAFAVRYVLFSAFEKKEKVFVIGYWFQSGIYMVPWLIENNSVNLSENTQNSLNH